MKIEMRCVGMKMEAFSVFVDSLEKYYGDIKIKVTPVTEEDGTMISKVVIEKEVE